MTNIERSHYISMHCKHGCINCNVGTCPFTKHKDAQKNNSSETIDTFEPLETVDEGNGLLCR